jgi:hypothetical protein
MPSNNMIPKDVLLFVNDFNIEFYEGMQKLSLDLSRKLYGIVLVDINVKNAKKHKPIVNDFFVELECDYGNPESIAHALNNYKDRLLLVNASSERNQKYYKLLIPHIPYIATPTEQSLEWTTRKDLMRTMCEIEDPAIVPKFLKISKLDSSTEDLILTTMMFPLITKPTGLAASMLVKKAYDLEELKRNLYESFEKVEEIYTRDGGRGAPEFLVEEFIEGSMYSVDAYVNEVGKVWCLPVIEVITAASIGLEGYYSYRNNTSHSLKDYEVSGAYLVVEKAIHATKLRNSAAHVELFHTKNGWKLIELGPRAGGYRQDMYMQAFGLDHAYNELRVKVGLEPEIAKLKNSNCSIVNVYCEKEGVIRSIKGYEEVSKLESVIWFNQYLEIGDKAIFCGNGGKYVFDGVLANDNLFKLEEDMNILRALITIEAN